MEKCIFCEISEGKIPSEKIYENDNFFSVLDINQEIKGHTLVISKKHFSNSLELPVPLGRELLDCIKGTSLKLMREYQATGFNLINNNFDSAGQIIKHFHVHILPRKEEDGIKIIT
jgi:histidine triad (HIT) family protein